MSSFLSVLIYFTTCIFEESIDLPHLLTFTVILRNKRIQRISLAGYAGKVTSFDSTSVNSEIRYIRNQEILDLSNPTS